jgi:mono/diheme cytochrome c family protein
VRFTLALALALTAAACGSEDPPGPGSDGGVTDAAAGNPDAGVSGAMVFANNCAFCHGADGKGTAAVPGATSLVLPAVQMKTDPQLIAIVTNGQANGAMPAFGATLSAADIAAVVAHVRTLD